MEIFENACTSGFSSNGDVSLLRQPDAVVRIWHMNTDSVVTVSTIKDQL